MVHDGYSCDIDDLNFVKISVLLYVDRKENLGIWIDKTISEPVLVDCILKNVWIFPCVP